MFEESFADASFRSTRSRMWIDYQFWYDRKTQGMKFVQDMYLLAAMGLPGGGRQQISRRLQSRFNLINMTFPFVREMNLSRY